MKRIHIRALLAAAGMLVAVSVISATHAHSSGMSQTFAGSASWYGGKFHGRKTANGELFDMNQLTAAHKTLPFGTRVKVTNNRNGKSVIVRINDRGPYVKKRVIDLSRKAAQEVGMIKSGTAPVTVEILLK